MNQSSVIGVVAEYNPFHNGHAYHIAASRGAAGENAAVVAVMSGGFVQRGGGAIIEKSRRAAAALRNGADVVIELPVFFASSSAESFAAGAVGLLDALGCVDYIAFGAETPDISVLEATANVLNDEPPAFKDALKAALGAGMPFASARAFAVEAAMGAACSFAIRTPNDILAVEYIKALKRARSRIAPLAVKRFGSGHDETGKDGTAHASASAIRAAALKGDFHFVSRHVPSETADALRECYAAGTLFSPSKLDGAAWYALSALGAERLKDIRGVGEGLENRLIDALKCEHTFEGITMYAKSKRYALSRLRRVVIDAVLGVTKERAAAFSAGIACYARVLGFRRDGARLLRLMSERSSVPLIIGAKHADILTDQAADMFKLDAFASELYRALAGDPRSEYASPVVVV